MIDRDKLAEAVDARSWEALAPKDMARAWMSRCPIHFVRDVLLAAGGPDIAPETDAAPTEDDALLLLAREVRKAGGYLEMVRAYAARIGWRDVTGDEAIDGDVGVFQPAYIAISMRGLFITVAGREIKIIPGNLFSPVALFRGVA